MLTVKNLKNTSDKNCKCGSWLDHWLKFNKGLKLPTSCIVNNCNNNVEVGAHVIKVNNSDTSHYIVPFCQAHNLSSDNLTIDENYLAPANKNLTCEKPTLADFI